MKKILILVSLSISILNAQLDVGVYYTYEDYTEDKFDPMVLDRYYYGFTGGSYKFYDDKSKLHEFNGKEIWGYKTHKGIFRMDPERRIPLLIVAVGEVVLYLDESIEYTLDSTGISFKQEYQEGFFGSGRSDGNGNKRQYLTSTMGYAAYVSRTLQSTVYPMFKGLAGEVKYEKIAGAFDGLVGAVNLQQCIASNYKNHPESIRCVLRIFPPQYINKGGGIFVEPASIGVNFK